MPKRQRDIERREERRKDRETGGDDTNIGEKREI